ALPARSGGIEVGLIAEPGHLDAELLRGPDDQGAGRHRDLLAVDRERHEILCGHAHSRTSEIEYPPPPVTATSSVSGAPGSAPASRAVAACSPGLSLNGQRPRRTCSSYSSMKYLREEWMGETAPSASAQNALNRMLSPTSCMSGMSSIRPKPFSIRFRTLVIHHVPSRHGVHL